MRRPFATMLLLSFTSLVGLIAFAAPGQQVPSQATQPAMQPAAGPATQPAAEAAPPAAPAGGVLTDDQGNAVPGVRMARADLRAVVRGPLAQVTLTLTFANNGDHIAGGDLMFPLPDGATVTGYALDVNGSMVDGVAVDKQQARDIYRNESARRVDPGLVEHLAGNAFHTRLYPIPARGSRTASVQYLTEIVCTGGQATLLLPMGWGDADKSSICVETPGASEPARLKAGNFSFHTPAQGYVSAEALKGDPDAMLVRLPGPLVRSAAIERRPLPAGNAKEPQGVAMGRSAGSDPVKRFEHFEYYFLLNDTPPAPAVDPAPEAAAELKAMPVRRVAILWDAGLSRAASDKQRELKLLDSLLQGWAAATGELVVFRDTVEAPVSFDLSTPDGRAKVIDQLSHLTYDGASDLGHLPLPKNAAGFTGVRPGLGAGAAPAGKPAADYDCLLLFTDGVADLGPQTTRKAEGPLYAFSDDPPSTGATGSASSPQTGAGQVHAGRAFLQKVCRDSGGRYFDLRNFSGEAMREPWSLLSVEFKPGEVAEVYPAGPIPVERQGRLTLTGRLLTPRATVTLNYGYGSRVFYRQPFTLKIADATGYDLIGRYWAQKKVADLSFDADLNETELTRIGKRFNLVTPYTSLLVLETVEQYERYHVVPPKSRPQLYQQFVDRMGPSSVDWESGEDAIRASGPSTSGANPVVIMGQDPSQETDEQALLGTVMVWDKHVRWWEDPKEFMTPPPEPSRDNALDWSDPRTAERRQTMQHAANLRRSRELTGEALRARQSGDLPDALNLYTQAVALNPDNSVAVRGQSELAEGSAVQDGNSSVRPYLAEQARKRAAESVSAFQATLDWSGQKLEQHDLAGADFEIDQARAALGNVAASPDDRTAFNGRLAEAKHRVDAARLAAARNARAAKEKLIADAHAQRTTDEMTGGVNRGGGVNLGGGYHRSDYSDGNGLFGGSGGGGRSGGGGASLFGGSGASGPAAGSAPPDASAEPPVASIGAFTTLVSNTILPWDPAMPYLAAMQAVPSDKAYDVYLEQRAVFGRCPEFYLDCGDFLQCAGRHAMAARVVSDVAALHLADASLLRRAAFRFQEIGEPDRAIELLERAMEMRPDDLRGFRDLALALADRADALADLPRTDSRRDGGRIAADYGRCLDLLNQTIVREARRSEVDVSCLMDANRVIARVRRLESAGKVPHVPVPLDPRLIRDLDCDLRVVLTSDTDGYRPDWRVIDPDGATAGSGFYVTQIGGQNDGGEYCLRTLLPGLYRVQTTGFIESRPERLTGMCTCRVTVFTDFGRATEKRKSVSLRMTDIEQKVDLGIVIYGGMAPMFEKADNVRPVETP